MLKNQKAFTLVELMVTLSVFAVLAFVALPSFQKQISNNRSLAFADEYISALNFVRSEAIKRGKPVTLCPASTTGFDCGSDWQDGWLAVIDTAATETTKPPVVLNEDAIIRRWEPNQIVVDMSESRKFIRYTSLGVLARVEGVSNAVIKVSAKKCSGNSKRVITISLAGMLTTTSATCS